MVFMYYDIVIVITIVYLVKF